jgi:Na+-driven multidrug efflux pump
VPGYPFNIFVILSGSFFVGSGYSFFGTITQLMRSIVFRVSAALIFTRLFSLDHIWWFQSLSFFLASFVAGSFQRYLRRKIKWEFAVNPKPSKGR